MGLTQILRMRVLLFSDLLKYEFFIKDILNFHINNLNLSKDHHMCNLLT